MGGAARARRRAYRAQLAYLFERSAFYREKLAAAGFASATRRAAWPTSRSCRSPTSTSSARRARPSNPIGAHLCAAPSEIVRIYSTSGTTGTPSYIPLTAGDLDNWVTGSARSYAASGIAAGQRIVSTYNAGPFVAGAALAAFDRIGLSHIPVGTGNTERLMLAIELLEPDAAVLTPSYAAHLVEWAAERGFDLAARASNACSWPASPAAASPPSARSSRRAGARGSPRRWASATSASRSGASARQQDGMHLGARGFVHAELIDPETGAAIEMDDGATRRARPDPPPASRGAAAALSHARPRPASATSPCACGRTGPRVRCIGRTDDMLIVRGVNVFPSAVREVVSAFAPDGQRPHPRQAPAAGREAGAAAPGERRARARRRADAALAEAIRERLRSVLVVQTRVDLVPWGSLQRSEYKSKLVEH